MVGTWTPPGAIFTVEFDDEEWSLKLVKRTSIPQDEPISWMTFNVSGRTWCLYISTGTAKCTHNVAYTKKHLRSFDEKMVQPCR